MFDAEAKRQLNMIPRIEKIHVEYQGHPENATLILNKVRRTASPEQAELLNYGLVDPLSRAQGCGSRSAFIFCGSGSTNLQ